MPFVTNPALDEIEVLVQNVSLSELSTPPFKAAVDKFYQSGKLTDGSNMPWPKETFDKVQAIK